MVIYPSHSEKLIVRYYTVPVVQLTMLLVILLLYLKEFEIDFQTIKRRSL